MTTCSILLLAASLHIGAQGDYREIHPSLGLECEAWSAGYFRNSEDGHSLWAAKRFTFDRLFAEVGVASGYEIYPIVPFIRIGYDFDYFEVSVAPSVEDTGNVMAVVMIQLKYSF